MPDQLRNLPALWTEERDLNLYIPTLSSLDSADFLFKQKQLPIFELIN